MDTGADVGPTIDKAAVWSGILNLNVHTERLWLHAPVPVSGRSDTQVIHCPDLLVLITCP